MKNQKGITLIALVVTILVLIIISSIVIKTNVGENGLITQANEMSKSSFDNNVRDALLLLQTQYTSKSEFMQFLKDEGYVDSDNVINVYKLLEVNEADYGVGKSPVDVYVLTDDMDLIYYISAASNNTIINIGTDMEE